MYIPLEISEAKSLPQGNPTIIVPFREQIEQKRGEQLKKFVSHIHRFHPDWNILVIEQSDDNKKFNRGSLLNIGARIAETNNIDYVIFHDVDLLPLMKIVPYYTAFPEKPIHIGKAWTEKYDSPSFLGGVLSMSIKDIKKTNGFPNQFWGWGGEDDALRNRIKAKSIEVYQPTMRGEGFKELKHVDSRSNQEWKNMRKWEDLKEDTGRIGYRNIKYNILDTQDISENIKKITVELK